MTFGILEVGMLTPLQVPVQDERRWPPWDCITTVQVPAAWCPRDKNLWQVISMLSTILALMILKLPGAPYHCVPVGILTNASHQLGCLSGLTLLADVCVDAQDQMSAVQLTACLRSAANPAASRGVHPSRCSQQHVPMFLHPKHK